MSETIPAPYINEPAVGYVYAALLSKNAQNKISTVLKSIGRELPNAIWGMPKNALHITLCEIIQSRKQYSEDKDILFEDRRKEYLEGAADAFTNTTAFSVIFNQIEVSQDAIIVRTQDGTAFNDIRAELTRHINLPDETKQPPNIVHSSIARFRQAVDIESVRSVTDNHTIDFVEEITEFKLLRTTIPPLLQYEELASFQLKASPLE